MTILLIAYVAWIPIRLYLVRKKLLGRFNFKKVNSWVNGRLKSELFKSLLFKLAYNWNIIVLITFWTLVLSVFSVIDIKGDLIFLAKRFGKISAVCLPTILFLTLRPSPLPHTLYLGLLPIHKWLSRLVILQAVIHTGLYIGFFNKQNTMHKTYSTKNLYGWVALTGFLIIIITSLLNLRNRFYRLFFINHYFWTWIIVITLQIHVRPVKYTWYTLINGSILIWQIVYRLLLTKVSTIHDFQVDQISPNLSLIQFPRELLYVLPQNPGAHLRLTNYHHNPLIRIAKQVFPNYHPYTLVSLPNDKIQKLIIRMDTFKLKNNQKYLVSGTYDPHLDFISSQSSKFNISKLKIEAKRLLIVVGGSAISFALPILRIMNYHGIPVKIVWVIRDFRDVLILNSFSDHISCHDFEIFVTAEVKKIPFVDDVEPRIDDSIARDNIYENVDVEVGEHDELIKEDFCGTPYSVTRKPSTISNYGTINNRLEENYYNEITFNNTISTKNFADLPTLSSVPLLKRSNSQKTDFSMNEQFDVQSTDCEYIEEFKEMVEKFHLNHKIYIGRPKLNHRYRNWCLTDGFTQCSGPVEGSDGDIICCRDVPQNKIVDSNVDTKDIWVVSAGPQGLVKNVKLWATENGLNFHEEAFYV